MVKIIFDSDNGFGHEFETRDATFQIPKNAGLLQIDNFQVPFQV
jgi:hypothetical protein